MGRAKNKAEFDPQASKAYFPIVLLTIVIGVTVLFREFIFSDLMLLGTDTINAGVFFRHFLVEHVLSTGSVPVWNPYIFGGMPFIDAFHGDTYYPLSFLKYVINFYRALGFNLLIHFVLAGITMYFCARQFRLSKVAATLSAMAYAFSGVIISLVYPGHDGKIYVIALFPLTILFLDRSFAKRPVFNSAALALVIGLILLTPHPQLSYYSLWAIAVYGLFKLVEMLRNTKSVSLLVKHSTLLIAATMVGLLISAIQFYPGYIYTTEDSPRFDTKTGIEWATSFSMHEEEALSLFIPEFCGSNTRNSGKIYWGKNAFKNNSEYVGIIPLLLSLLAIFFYRRKEVYFFAGLAGFALLYALGDTTPFFLLFYKFIPFIKSVRAPSNIMFLFCFCTALLSGMSIQYLIEHRPKKAIDIREGLRKFLVIVPAVYLITAILFTLEGESILWLYSSIFYSGIETIRSLQGNVSKWDMALANLPHIRTGVWMVFVLTSVIAITIMQFLKRRYGITVLLILPLLTMVDGIVHGSRYVSTFDHHYDTTPNYLTEYLSELPGKFRVWDPGVFFANYLPFHGIEVVDGYHGNQLRWYDDLLGGVSKQNIRNPRFLNLVGTKYIIGSPTAVYPPHYFGPHAIAVDRQFDRVTVYRNDNAFPRTYLASRYEVIGERTEINQRVLHGDRDLRSVVYLEKPPPIDIQVHEVPTDGAKISSYAVDSVVVQVNTSGNALLVLTDCYYRNWEAWVDGSRAEILRAQGAFRAVAVPAGSKTVLFKYSSGAYTGAGWVTALSLLLVLGVFAVSGIRTRVGRHRV